MNKSDLSAPGVAIDPLQEHSVKVMAQQPLVVTTRRWEHAFGVMVIETCVDGSVWIDGKPVPETLPGVAGDAA